MFDVIVSIVFWSVFSVPALLALSWLCATFGSNDRFMTALKQVDDGSDEPGSASLGVYELSLRSDLLSIVAGVTFLPLAASIMLAFLAPTILASFLAICRAVVSLVVSVVLRVRHAELETSFYRYTGLTVKDACAIAIDPSFRPPRTGHRHRSASSR